MNDIENNANEPIRLVFFGDSICVGQGISIHKGWVPRISAMLEALGHESGRELLIENASVSGNTTRQALERMAYQVQSHGVDMLLIQFGMNDCNHWESDRGLPRVSKEAFRANLQEIIARGRRFGAQRVILNTNHPTSRTEALMPGGELTYQQGNEIYNQIIREVAALENVFLNDIEKYFLSKTDAERAPLANLLLPDGLHLSEKGHDLYYEATAPLVEDMIRTVFFS